MEKQTLARGEQVEQALIAIAEEHLADVDASTAAAAWCGAWSSHDKARGRQGVRSAPSNSGC